MKKIISIKEITMILIAIVIVSMTLHVFAFDPSQIINNTTTITDDEYEDAQDNNTENNTVNNTVNNSNNNNTSSLPQTGIEDYNVGILLVICIASAIYAHKKVSDYRNI